MIASLTSMLYQDAPNVIAEKLTGTSYTNPKVVDLDGTIYVLFFNVTSLFDARAMRKQLLDALRALVPRTESKKQPLGRWTLKTCDELATGVNAVYQNRDHCGDVICKTPKRASDYIETNK